MKNLPDNFFDIGAAGVALLILSSPALANDKLYSTYTEETAFVTTIPMGSIAIEGPTSGVSIAISQPPQYSYEPKDDVTTWELSEIIKILLPAIGCRHLFDDCGATKKLEAAPPEVRRHFVRQ